MGGTGSPSQKTMVDAATNTETTTKTYAQAAAQSQAEKEEKEKRKERGPIPVAELFSNLPKRHAFVEDLSEYEKEEEVRGTMAKAIIVHGVPTEWRIGGVARCLEMITGQVIGVLYCIVLYLQPVLNPKSYDGARVLEASGRPMLVIGRSYWIGPIQEVEAEGDAATKFAEETTE